MRCDASVSVRPLGSSELRPRAEIKNVNSVKFAMQAIDFEARRQVEIYENGGTIEQQTRNFDQNSGETKFLRAKENANEIVIKTIINMASDLGMHVVCEGVEEIEQAHLLRSFHCPTVQGFLFDEPLSHHDFETRLRKERIYNKM